MKFPVTIYEMSYDKPIQCEVVRMPSALTYRSCLLLIVNIYWFLSQEMQASYYRQTNQFSGSDKRLRHFWYCDRVSNFSNMWQVYCSVCSVSPSESLVFTAILVPFNIQILQIPSFLYFSDERREIEVERQRTVIWVLLRLMTRDDQFGSKHRLRPVRSRYLSSRPRYTDIKIFAIVVTFPLIVQDVPKREEYVFWAYFIGWNCLLKEKL